MNATQRFHSLYLFGMFCTLPSIAILSIICTYMKLHIVWWWWRLVGWMACERYLNGNVAREKVCGNGGKMAAPQCQFSTDKIYWPKTQTISQFSASSLTHSHALGLWATNGIPFGDSGKTTMECNVRRPIAVFIRTSFLFLHNTTCHHPAIHCASFTKYAL